MEKTVRKKGFKKIAGVDEAGRGPLAGPVVAAACIIAEGVYFPGVNDCKLLTPQKRRELFQTITKHKKVMFGVGKVGPKVIDEVNIYQATLIAMREAIYNLPQVPDYVLVDGLNLTGIEPFCEKVIKGDQKSHVIAAASIIAKCTRDDEMLYWHSQYPQYGFDAHKGYGTEKHRKALEEFGPSPIHRRSFRPVGILEAAAYE